MSDEQQTGTTEGQNDPKNPESTSGQEGTTKASGKKSSQAAKGANGGAYFEMTGTIIGHSTGSHPDEPSIVTIQINGGQDLIIPFPSSEAAKTVPMMTDMEGNPRTVPVKITVSPGEGAPSEADVEAEAQAKADAEAAAASAEPPATPPDQATALSRREAASKGETLPSDDAAKARAAKTKALPGKETSGDAPQATY